MLPTLKFHASTPPKPFPFRHGGDTRSNDVSLRWENASPSRTPSALRFYSLSLTTAATTLTSDAPPSSLTASVGSPPSVSLTEWNLNRRHIHLLNAIACLAFKKAAESLEKLMDVTREELPDTMAAVRLSGMEISDLTMELSDLGQEITQGVRNSTRAVRLAEDRLHRLTNFNATALVQEEVTLEAKTVEPVVAKSARNLKEGIVKGGMAVTQPSFYLHIELSTGFLQQKSSLTPLLEGRHNRFVFKKPFVMVVG
ncbi:hypothetical protein ACLOJK_016113 [Asimina triloba]